MKKMEWLIFIVIFGTCGLGFGLPFLLTGTSAQRVYDSDLIIPNTGRGTATATRSTERVLTIQAVSTLFNTSTNTPEGADTLTPTDTLVSSSVFSPTPIPSQTLTSVTLAPTITRRPRVDPTRTLVAPTRTALAPTRTPVPPTNTKLPSPTSTKQPPPPTNTKIPTPIPPTPITPVYP